MTRQQKLAIERDSERQRIEESTRGNTASIGYANGRAGLMARDYSGRIVLVSLDRVALRALIAEALETDRAMAHDAKTETDNEPPTKRDGSASTWPAPEDERIDETRGAT